MDFCGVSFGRNGGFEGTGFLKICVANCLIDFDLLDDFLFL